MRRISLIMIAFVLCAVSLSAETAGVAKLLTEEKATLLDLGTSRILAKLDIATHDLKKTLFSAAYNPKADKLEFVGQVTAKFSARAEAESCARELVTRIRQEFFGDITSANPNEIEKKQQETLAKLFSAVDGSGEASPDKIGPYLRGAIEFELRLPFGNSMLQCKSNLIKKDLDFFVKDTGK